MTYTVAGIDVHKKVLMVVIAALQADRPTWQTQRQRFGTTTGELQRLSRWLREQGAEEAVMESTAQYWKPVWYELEPHMRLQLAQAYSNRAPRGRKHDFKDAERLVADELRLSFVPGPEQRTWRTMTRMRVQLVRDRVRIHNQMESLLEEMRLKLSSVVSDLLGVSGRRILQALAAGQTDARKLAELGDPRLHCSQQQLAEALTLPTSPSSSSSSSVLERESTFADEVLPDAETKLLRLAKSHPEGKRVLGSQLPNDLATAMIEAITLEAVEQGISQEQACEYLVQRNLLYARAVANWPPSERRFIANHARWYTNHEYRDDPETWVRGPAGNARSKSAVSIPQRSAAAEMQRQLREG